MTTALECLNVSKSFGALPVLQHVNLSVRAGQVMSLLGPSGCGKTTMLRLIAGFEWPDAGTIIINGRVVASEKLRIEAEDRRAGMVFQEYALFPHHNVADNVAFGLRGSSSDKAVRVEEMLALVGLSDLAKRMPYELSGGQQQRVALARALAPNPAVLLLDEPFSNLDTALRGQMRGELRAILKRSGITAVFVTHDQEEALSLSDAVAVMLDGHIAQVDEPQQLYQHPVSREVAAFVGEANFIRGHASGTHAQSVLGGLSLYREAHGPVDILIRPESLRLTQNETTTYVTARIVWREFYGHTQRVGLALDDVQLIARIDAMPFLNVGETVGVSVTGPVIAYPL